MNRTLIDAETDRTGFYYPSTIRSRDYFGEGEPDDGRARVDDAAFANLMRVYLGGRVRRLKTNKILHGYRRQLDTLTDTIAACAAPSTMPALS